MVPAISGPRHWAARLCLLTLLAAGCGRPPAPAPLLPPAEKPRSESDLARTTLSPQACRSLGVTCATIPARTVQDHAALTGWVMARQGNEVTLTAPVAGFVRDPGPQGTTPVAGLPVRAGQELFAIEPVLSPVEQVQLAALKRDVENHLAKAQESVTAAEKELRRMEDLYRQRLRGEQDVEQARARFRHAEEDLTAAQDKSQLFEPAGATGVMTLRAGPVRAPRPGTVLAVPVSPGQYVAAAAPLVTLADLSVLWVRVPVPEHDLQRVDYRRAVAVAPSAAGEKVRRFDARPVAVVPQVDLARHTADLVYELTPYPRDRLLAHAVSLVADGVGPWTAGVVPVPPFCRPPPERPLWAKDQMVTVWVPLDGRHKETVVPYAAVVFDAQGGAWVYLDRTAAGAAEHVYERRRVELGPTVEGGVVVRPPVLPDDRVVVTGAAALFSREFHKPPTP